MSNQQSATGRIIHITRPENKAKDPAKSFFACEVVIETEARFNNTVPFQFTGDRADRTVNFNIGDQVEIWYDLGGREWQGKYYPQLNGWKIEAVGAQQPAPQSQPAQQGDSAVDIFGNAPAPAKPTTLTEEIEEKEDLPW